MLRAVTASAALQTRRRALHASALRSAVVTVNVPSMGDSISEGTLVSVAKGAGEQVAADEVVLVLETDKVSVDVMSPVAGTVVQLLAQIDDNVVVGAPLFTVDDSLAPAAGQPKPAPVVAAAPAATPAAAPAQTASGHRTPLIKFLGKRSLLPHVPIPKHASELAAKPAAVKTVQPSGPGVLPFTHTKRLPLSQSEIEAINSGVAFL